MANGRPTGGASDRSSRRTRGKAANQEGLAALGRQVRSGPGDQCGVANESGLRALGARIDAAGPGRRRTRRSGKAKWSPGKKVVVALLCVLLIGVAVVGGGYGYLWYRYSQINKIHISDEVAGERGALHDPGHRLGLPRRRVGASGQGLRLVLVVTGQRSDVVQLWRVTPSTKQIQIVSIPRDTVVSMLPPDNAQYGTYNRINSSYNSGANQLVKTITANFGIPINHVVQVDFSGFQDSVNALGGIYLDFPYPAKDSYSGLDITTPGCQLLSGAQALAVARARHYEYYTNGYWHYRPDERLRAHPAPGRVHQGPDDLGQVEGEPADGQRVHRLGPRGRPDRRRLRLQRADRARPRPTTRSTPPTWGARRCPRCRPTGSAAWATSWWWTSRRPSRCWSTSSARAWSRPPTRRPDASGNPNPPPPVTPTTVAPASPGTPTTAAGAATTTQTTAPSAVVQPDELHPDIGLGCAAPARRLG